MEIPSIKLNSEKNKIENIDSLKSYINSYNNLEELAIYYDKLIEQTKVPTNVLNELIDFVKSRLDVLNYFYSGYKDVVTKDNTEYKDNIRFFLNDNIHLIESLKNSMMNNTNLSDSMCYLIKEFLNHAIDTEDKYHLINSSEISKLFTEFSIIINTKIKNNYFKSDKERQFYYEIKEIIDKKNSIINKKQEEDDYKDNDYLSRTQVLKFSPSSSLGHSLTEEDSFKYGGYIVTTILLESTLALALIILLILLFK